ncbi:RHS repeat-associated protein [Luteibacter sp. 621]|uniref:RHS repeat-associated core domain-containing protein n=1 Tax=Luteibacter sp. 621 TaxID=3373916 RepID=UPI003D21A58C
MFLMSSMKARRRRILATATAAVCLASFTAHADYVYGPPYSYNGAYGAAGGFTSVDAAVNDLIAHYENDCSTTLTCKPHTFSTAYGSTGTAATITINWVNADGSTGSGWFSYIWATDVTGQGFQPKNAGGCQTGCTGGNGAPGDSLGPRGSSQEGDTKTASGNAGTSMEGDPINAANGNAYRQDTDLHTSDWLTFRRFYNSSSFVVASTLGPKWRHSFDRSIQLMPNSGPDAGLLYARRPDGSLVRFRSANGIWTADTDSAETLTIQKDPKSGATTGYALRVAATQDTEAYDANGRLLSIADDNGQTTTLTYSTAATDPAVAPSAGLLITVTDPQGRALGLRYDSQGRLSVAIDPAGQTATYTYGADGNLSKVTYPDLSTRQYVYAEPLNAPGAATYPSELTGVIDEKGVRFETTAYDAKNHAVSSQYAGGADKMTLSYYGYYQNGGTPAGMTTPLGLSVTLAFADDGAETLKPSGTNVPCGNQCNQQSKKITYDTNGYPASYTDFRGAITTTTYDANGLLTRQVEASGTDAQRATSTTWDVPHRRPLTRAMSNAAGIVVAKSAWSYNARGQATAECAIDPSVTVPYACGSQAHAPEGIRQTRYTYCDAVDSTQCPKIGLLLTADGPRTDVTDVIRYSYYLTTDESGCATVGGACHRAGDAATVTDQVGHVTTFVSYDRHGRLLRQKDANGVITDVAYSPRGWLISKVVRANPDGSPSAADATTTLTYEPTGALKTVTDADGVALTYTYDDAHRLIDMADGQANHVHYTLDPSGNRTKEQTFDATGALRRSLSQKYNALGQLVSTTDGLGHITFDATASGSYDGDGKLISGKDALGIARKDTVDLLGRVVTSIADANGTNSATKASTAGFTFDALDQIKSFTDPDGLITTFTRDGLSNAIGRTSPDTGPLSMTFDSAGNATTRTDAKGVVESRAYDALGRTTALTYADTSLNAIYGYDESDSATGCAKSFPVGRLTRIVEAKVTTAYCYDNEGRVTEKRQTQNGVTDAVDYAYSRAGRLSGIAPPSGNLIAYARNTLGQITSITLTPPNHAAIPLVSNVTYLPFGPATGYTLGNGQAVTRTYNANYVITDINSPSFNVHYDLDASGQVIALRGSATGPVLETYTYDGLHRLSSIASATFNESYTYDKSGNRLSKVSDKPTAASTGVYTYAPGTHRLVDVAGSGSVFDANGAMTQRSVPGGSRTYAYDGRGNLVQASADGSQSNAYRYNVMNQRIFKATGDGQQLRFVYDEEGQLLAESGGLPHDYVWMDGLLIGSMDSASPAYVVVDALGTPRRADAADGSGRYWEWQPTANPFGERNFSASYVFNLRYPGQYFDSETGLFYNGHRYYHPDTGRYLESDPIGLMGGTGTYVYALGNPFRFSDPYGLWAWGDPLPQGLVDFAAGFGDTVSFGLTDWTRDQLGTNDVVDHCSRSYTAGQVAGVALDFAAGGAAGLEAAGTRGVGKEFSHWIPRRLGGSGSLWNGNYVTPIEHALSDPYRYRFAPAAWKNLNPMPNMLVQQLNRVPYALRGLFAGGLIGADEVLSQGDCGCQ